MDITRHQFGHEICHFCTVNISWEKGKPLFVFVVSKHHYCFGNIFTKFNMNSYIIE